MEFGIWAFSIQIDCLYVYLCICTYIYIYTHRMLCNIHSIYDIGCKKYS